MAMVDFTNAKIEPMSNAITPPFSVAYCNLETYVLKNPSGQQIGSGSSTKIVNTAKKIVYSFAGTFNASGTEFYIWYTSPTAGWKISNISFQSGDTYSFQIPVTLICN